MKPDELDNLIQAALRGAPEVDALRVARLEELWRRASRRRRRRWRTAAALAASLAAAAAWYALAPRRGEPRAGAPQQPDVAANGLPTPPAEALVEREGDPQHDVAGESASVGRLPTAYERLIFAAQTRSRVDAELVELGARVDAAIERLANSADAPAAAASGEFAGAGPRVERLLLARLRRASSTQRRVIVQLLALHGTAESLPALVQAAEQADVREAALAAVQRLADGAKLGAAVRLARNPGVRRELLTRLLADGSNDAILSFLSLAADVATRDDALAAARGADALPVEGLMLFLEHDDRGVRLAAASVLGSVGGSSVSEALVARLSRPERAPVEAWVALLACRGPRVEQFLARASAEPRLLGQVNNARAYWARFVP